MSPPTRSLRPAVGDLVVCRDDDWREQMHLPPTPGLVVGDRRNQVKVFFPDILGDTWIPLHQLARIREPSQSELVPPWLQRVWYLARTLDAVGLEGERLGPEGNAVRVYHGEMDLALTDRIRADLGEELRYYALAPAGLHKMESAIAFVTVDRAPPQPPATAADA